MLETVIDFMELFYDIEIVEKARVNIGETNLDYRKEDSNLSCKSENTGVIYCSTCGNSRKYKFDMAIKKSAREDFFNNKPHLPHNIFNKCKDSLDSPTNWDEFKEYVYTEIAKANVPILITGTCLQCDGIVNIIIYNENNKLTIVKLYENGGGVTTEHTPESIRYYLDEAYKCKTIGAYTGAVAMYRTALENLLYDNGYTKGMLADKIRQFEEDKKNGTGPRWSEEIRGEILDKIRGLGNYAVHSNKGNIGKQTHLQDETLLICIDDVFKYILKKIYEDGFEQNALLDKLKRTSINLKK